MKDEKNIMSIFGRAARRKVCQEALKIGGLRYAKKILRELKELKMYTR